MGGFVNSISNKNDAVFAKNADFSLNPDPSSQNGLILNGQLWIGHTDANLDAQHVYVGNIVSPGGTILVGYSSPNITIDVLTGGFSWVDISGGFSANKQTGYFITGTATATLPAGPSQGDTIKFFVDHPTQDLTIQASPGQTIRMGALITSVAGTALSTSQGDTVELVFRASNNSWQAVCGMIGTWVIA
jgi:hypothetical protein